jgi:hypothetical protein
MWCRMVDIEAHHACWLLLQALFMTASVLTATSTTAMYDAEELYFFGYIIVGSILPALLAWLI